MGTCGPHEVGIRINSESPIQTMGTCGPYEVGIGLNTLNRLYKTMGTCGPHEVGHVSFLAG